MRYSVKKNWPNDLLYAFIYKRVWGQRVFKNNNNILYDVVVDNPYTNRNDLVLRHIWLFAGPEWAAEGVRSGKHVNKKAFSPI